MRLKRSYTLAKWVGKKRQVKGESNVFYHSGTLCTKKVSVGEAKFGSERIIIRLDSLPINFNGSITIDLPKEIADTAKLPIKKRKKPAKKKKVKKKSVKEKAKRI